MNSAANKARLTAASKSATKFGATVESCDREIRYNTMHELSRGGTAFVKRGNSGECFAILSRSGRIVAIVTEYSDGWGASKPSDEKACLSKEFPTRSSIFADGRTLAECVKRALEAA